MRRTTPLSRFVLFAALVMLAVPSLAAARGWLGVYTQEVTRDLREALDLTGEGVLVSSVVPGSPADRAGLRKGDVIVSVDRRDVGSPAELTGIIGDTREGESVSLGVVRKGAKLNLAVRLAARPDDDEIAPPAPRAAPAPRAPKAPAAPKEPRVYRWHSDGNADPDEIRERIREAVPGFDFDFDEAGPGRSMVWMGNAGRGRLGVRVESLSEDLASALGSPGTRGALVVEVLKQTPAEEAGLRAGDVITAVEGAAVQDGDDLVKALKGESGRVSLSIVRRGEKRTVEAALEDSPRAIRLRDGKGPMGPGRLGDDRRFDVRIKGDADGEDLRRELQELREQLRELRRELQENRR